MGRRPKEADVDNHINEVDETGMEKTSKSSDKEKKTKLGLANLIANIAVAFGVDAQDLAISYLDMLLSNQKIRNVLIENLDEFKKAGLSGDAIRLINDIDTLSKA